MLWVSIRILTDIHNMILWRTDDNKDLTAIIIWSSVKAVIVRRSSRNVLLFQVVIRAERVNDPDRYAEVRVYVRVTRNPSRPTFSHGDLVFNISETIQLASVFGKVNASDPDTVGVASFVFLYMFL